MRVSNFISPPWVRFRSQGILSLAYAPVQSRASKVQLITVERVEEKLLWVNAVAPQDVGCLFTTAMVMCEGY